ncbi:MAG: hypothetical protein JWP12_1966 [Bacteroidetes bacterium]|nr:hypothetical protein [Bacteroidota bacterium]
MSKKNIILLLFLTLFSFKTYATHIVGGEIFYDYLGANNYKITLKLYRDCYLGQAPYDDPATIFIFNSSGGFLDSIPSSFPGSVVLPITINNPCFTPPTDVCVEEAIYTYNINLPAIPGGYDIVYQRCCRNGSILNLINPGNVGSTYMAHIPDQTVALNNNSPRYNHFPPIFLCAGVPLVFDHSATDPDGDSIYYELCDPFTGLTPCCPILGRQAIGTGGSCSSGCALIADPPPYPFVPWATGYSASYPMSASPALAIDSHTGLMTGTPNTIGQWVVGVCASEYRNGVLVDVNKRDFQFNVVNCPGLPVASIPVQTDFCFGYQANFTQNSLNATTYQWDFGDLTTTSDVSTAFAPSWTYPDSGVYTVTLVINPGTLCADTNTTTFDIQHLLQPNFVVDPGECIYDNHFSFTAAGDFTGNGTFAWDFGTHNPVHTATGQTFGTVSFDTTGTFPVTLTVTENGCMAQFTNNVTVYAKPEADYTLESPVACKMQPVHFMDHSLGDGPFSYQWLFGDGSVSSEKNPYHVYNDTGSYSTTLIITSAHGCVDTVSLPAATAVFPSPEAGFAVTPADTSIFFPDVTMVDQSTGATGCNVSWGDGASYGNCDSVHRYTHPGTYTIMQMVVNEWGCRDTAYSQVLIRPEFIFWIPNAFTPYQPNGLNDIFKPKLIGVHDYSFLIFDRWGEKIYETNNSDDGWDGRFKGRLCTNDVYVYKITFRDDVRNDPHQYIGRVTLVR